MICLDTQVAIYCMGPKTDELGERASALLARLDKQHTPVMLSSIVVAELLAGVPQTNEVEFLRILKERFVLPVFDSICALHFARIWRTYRDRVREFQIEGLTRNRVRVDWLIVASALAHGAQAIYSEDQHVHRCAEGLIEVRYLHNEPIPPKQDMHILPQ